MLSPCPSPTLSLRDEQCAAYNKQALGGIELGFAITGPLGLIVCLGGQAISLFPFCLQFL